MQRLEWSGRVDLRLCLEVQVGYYGTPRGMADEVLLELRLRRRGLPEVRYATSVPPVVFERDPQRVLDRLFGAVAGELAAQVLDHVQGAYTMETLP